MQVIWPEGFEIETNTEGLPEPPKNGNGGNSNSGDDELTCRKGNKVSVSSAMPSKGLPPCILSAEAF